MQRTQLITTSLAYYFIVKLIGDPTNGALKTDGLFPDIVRHLQVSLNFSIVVTKPADGKFGGLHNGMWNGMVRMLQDGVADLAVAPLSHTLQRSAVIDFSRSLFEDNTVLIAPSSQAPEIKTWLYRSIFPDACWVIFAALAALVAAAFMAISASGLEEFSEEEFTLFSGAAISMRLILQLNCTIRIRRLSSKILFFTASASFYVVFSFYSSGLTALMTSTPPPAPIASFADVLRLGYSVIATADSVGVELLAGAAAGSDVNQVFKKMQDRNALCPTQWICKKRILKEVKTLYFGGIVAVSDTRYIYS